MAQDPMLMSDTSTTEGSRPFPGQKSRGDAARDSHAAHGIAIGTGRHPRDPGAPGGGGAPRAAHAAPERGSVVSPFLGVGSPLAVATARARR